LIVRAVIVEGVDDIIAISPGVLKDDAAKGERFAEARDIKPMPSPALAEFTGRKQSINEFFVTVGSGIFDKCIDLFRRRRKSREIKINPPDECYRIGIGNRMNAAGLQFGEDEAVDIVLRPGLIMDDRYLRTSD
jgi:hypothetical protein